MNTILWVFAFGNWNCYQNSCNEEMQHLFLSPILFSEELQKSLPWSSPSCVKIRLSPFGSLFLKYVVLLVQNFNTINSSRSNQDKNRFFFEEKKVKFGLSCLDTLFLKWYQCTKYYIENDLTRPPPTKSWKLHLRRETELR